MNLRHIGYALILLALLQIAMGFALKDQINTLKLVYMPQSCHEGNDVNTCPVLRDNVDWPIAAIWAGSLGLALCGIYLSFLHQEARQMQSENKALIKRIGDISKEHDSHSKFEILLKGLSGDEQAVMRQVHAQDGIGQNTLCIRTGMSKAKLSALLTELEKRNLVVKKPEGKINRIFLKGAF